MEITKIYVKPLPKRLKRLAGTASIILDNMIAINDIKIFFIEEERRFFVEFPNNDKTKRAGREIIAPLNRETREYVENEIMKEFYIQDKIKHGRIFVES